MNTRKLKAIFTTACCLVVALCSEIKSMDTASNLQETPSYKAQQINSEGCLDSLKTEMGSNSSSAQLFRNQDENKDLGTSWASYMSYPVKAVIHGTYNIFDFTVKNPKQTIITALIIGAELTVAAAYCNCILNIHNAATGDWIATSLGLFPNETECQAVASSCPGGIHGYPCQYNRCV
jgi:hypothetical protein